MPKWLGSRLRGWTTARPYLERPRDCTKCKRCEESCPVSAIRVDNHGPAFDNATCIRCYCCQELCPPQAIGLTVPPLARLATRGRGR
jgi:ferredoxin